MKEVEDCFFTAIKTGVDNLEKAIYNYSGCSATIIRTLITVRRMRELLDSVEVDIRWIQKNEGKEKDCVCPSSQS